MNQCKVDQPASDKVVSYVVYGLKALFLQGFTGLNAQTDIGIKLMGILDKKPFLNVCKKKYSANEATAQAATLRSIWQENVEDLAWHPFKKEGTGDKAKYVLCHCHYPTLQVFISRIDSVWSFFVYPSAPMVNQIQRKKPVNVILAYVG